MKVFISKYALSGKITEHECDPPREGSKFIYPGEPFAGFTSFLLGRDAHSTKEAAIIAVNIAKKKKIAGLQKQITKLEKLNFE